MADTLFQRMYRALAGEGGDASGPEAAMKINRYPRELMMLPVDWNPANVPDEAIVQIKHDGWHMGWAADRGAFTREGVHAACAMRLAPELTMIDAQLSALFGELHVLFGEYVHTAGFNAAIGDLKRGTGDGIVMLFDAVPMSVWLGQSLSPPLKLRLLRLQRAYGRVPCRVVGLSQSSLFVGAARDRLELVAADLWQHGHEGIVVKDAASPYVRAASPYWQRIKRVDTADGMIVSHGLRDDGTLRGILVRLNGTFSTGSYVEVGVGFSDAQRRSPADFRTGRMVEIKHLGVTQCGSLRSPSFLRFRDDKC